MAYRRKTRAWSLALCASTILAFSGSGAQAADQFKQAADGASIECAVSARELTRFALVDDQFASVSKISTGTPYNDFAVTNEPLRGDIYVSVPETYAARSISFFATTKKGFVYKVSCQVEPVPAVQVFITNPAIATNKASGWESETPLETSAVRLIQAMANDRTVEGFEVRQSSALPARVTHLEKTGETAKLNEELKRRTIARVNRPEPVAGINAAAAARSWRFDPTISVDRDIANDKGRVIVAAGTRVNPLDTVPLRVPLVFLDGDDPEQLAWATRRYASTKAKLILVRGAPLELMKARQRRFYFDQGGSLVKHFGIRAVPATVEQQGRVLIITEQPVRPKERASS